MKIAHIVNNFGKVYDGIGAYAKIMCDNLPDGVEEIIYSAECHESNNKLKYIFNFGMTKEIFKCIKNIFIDNVDVFLIEYPFKEWNPAILIPLNILSRRADRDKILLCL